MRDAVRVALLARPGAGADRLRDALNAAGAELVLDADPMTLEPATLAGAGAESVVVLLDAAVEDALDRLDSVLHDPAMDVLYEESEVAAAREGWDMARWTRHLSAKLKRHDDVLPPGRESDGAPARAPAPARPMFDPVAAEYEAPTEYEIPGAIATRPPIGDEVAADDGLVEMTFEMPPEVPVELPGEAEPAPSPHAAPGDAIRDFRRDLADIEQRIASMGLVADEPAAAETAEAAPAATGTASALGLDPDPPVPELDQSTSPLEAEPAPAAAAIAKGAVLVFAGIGGPDAVRQFLGALPDAFPRPVLIHQRLDGGRHDRLVQQMARATSLPVQLAVEHDPVAAGHVYILPPGLRICEGDGGLCFAAGDDPMASLPAAESAVLMFSGSDTAMVDAAMQHAESGALVAGQSPEDCYDAAAADALVARGAQSGQPAELARRLADRWAA